MIRAGISLCVLLVGCSGIGDPPPVPPMQHMPCEVYGATSGPPAFARAEVLFRGAMTVSEVGRGGEAGQGFLAAAEAFQAASAEDPSHVVARTNMRIAYADAALAWLSDGRPASARAALEQARAADPDLQDRWQRALDELPRPPRCGFTLQDN